MPIPPSALIQPTICLLIEPASTISTISTVFWSVTRRPPSNSRLDAQLGQHGADLRAAAMHDDRVDARLLEQRDVAGETPGRAPVAHGMAAIFHHDRPVLVALHVHGRYAHSQPIINRTPPVGAAIGARAARQRGEKGLRRTAPAQARARRAGGGQAWHIDRRTRRGSSTRSARRMKKQELRGDLQGPELVI